MFMPKKLVVEKFLEFLKEDLGQGDVTTSCIVPSGMVAEAEIIAKEEGIVAGIEEATTILNHFGFEVEAHVAGGSHVKPRTTIMQASGDAGTLLSLERTLLNLFSRMCGVATATWLTTLKLRKAGFKTKVASTRKTAPGLLYFDKKAVEAGGGDTHRLHLDDLVLIKDNHIAVAGGVEKALKQARIKASFAKKIEVEVATVEDALKAAQNGADIIMFDNFPPRKIKEALRLLERKRLRSKVLVEASGGITQDNVLEYAAAGVDIVSLGELTDSVKSLDISLEIRRRAKKL